MSIEKISKLEKVGEVKGISIYREENGAGGHTYWADDIGGGRRCYDTSLDDADIIAFCQQHAGVGTPATPALLEAAQGTVAAIKQMRESADSFQSSLFLDGILAVMQTKLQPAIDAAEKKAQSAPSLPIPNSQFMSDIKGPFCFNAGKIVRQLPEKPRPNAEKYYTDGFRHGQPIKIHQTSLYEADIMAWEAECGRIKSEGPEYSAPEGFIKGERDMYEREHFYLVKQLLVPIHPAGVLSYQDCTDEEYNRTPEDVRRIVARPLSNAPTAGALKDLISDALKVSETKESAIEYLRSEGIDPDTLIKNGMQRISQIKSAQALRERYKNDAMFEMLDVQLEIAFEGARRREPDPTGYLLSELRKRGYEVVKSEATHLSTPIPPEKRGFGMPEFEKGLMLAGLVSPANEQEVAEKEALDEFDALGKQPRVMGFHSQDQLFFRRRQDGSVTIEKISNDFKNGVFIQTLDANTWMSVIGAVSKIGSGSESWKIAKELHEGTA